MDLLLLLCCSHGESYREDPEGDSACGAGNSSGTAADHIVILSPWPGEPGMTSRELAITAMQQRGIFSQISSIRLDKLASMLPVVLTGVPSVPFSQDSRYRSEPTDMSKTSALLSWSDYDWLLEKQKHFQSQDHILPEHVIKQ